MIPLTAMDNEQQRVAGEQHPKPRGTPWPKGVSGNPTGSKLSKRAAELFAATLVEFDAAALTPSDRALLETACKLLARRWRDEATAVKASNVARNILRTLHQRHKTNVSKPARWAPLRARLDAAVAAKAELVE
jgi:hypothetical protein